ncbi:MAG: endonuclease, partial [Bacteroidales bacterium]|nr:endonuclease [Bacteroidales bacterium]
TALFNIIKNHTVKPYDYLYTAYQTTDNKGGNQVWDMYSDVPGGAPPYVYYFNSSDECGSYNSEGDCYNREHSVPASWFKDASPMYTDIFLVVPTDGYVNNRRSNYPYAKVGNATWTSMNGSKVGSCNIIGYSSTVFEPIDAYKGDFSRAYFYLATRYEDRIAGWVSNSLAGAVLSGTSYPAFKSWYLNMLMSWHLADPVSAKEIARNNAIYAIQGNRNPYIDHPEYVAAVWNPTTPAEPTAYPTVFSANTITLRWTDATGTIVPEGYLIRMSTTSFVAITDPVDGAPVDNDFSNKNVSQGIGNVTFGGLTPNTMYYFKIYSYTGSGTIIDYKTGDGVPQGSIEAK